MKIKFHKKSYATFFALLGIIAFWGILLYFYSPQVLIEKIGVQNSYIVIGVVAVLGGVSSITGASFYTTLTTFAAGGADPLLLGLIGGIGVTFGDSFFYYLGLRGKDLLSGKPKKISQKMECWINKKPSWVPQAIAFIYTALTPLPNDILMVSLAISKVSYKKIIFFVLIGNIGSVIFFAYLARKGVEFFT